MALQLTSTNLDLISVMAFGAVFASLADSNQKTLLAGAASPSLPSSTPGGVAGLTLNMVNQYATAMGMVAANDPPAAWDYWFVAETVARAVQAYKPDQYAAASRVAAQAAQSAIESLSIDAVDSTSLLGQTFSYQSIRQYILGHCVRQRRRVFPTVQEIDSHIQWSISFIFNKTFWAFRRRQVTFTVDTAGAVAFQTGLGSGETFGASASNRFYFKDPYTGAVEAITSDMVAQKYAESPTLTGQPQFVRINPVVGGAVWHWVPMPDKTYTLYGEVYIGDPTAAATPQATTIFSVFPPAFRPIIRDVALARVMNAYGVGNPETIARAFEAVDELLPQYQDLGGVTNRQTVEDVYGDARAAGDGYGPGGVL